MFEIYKDIFRRLISSAYYDKRDLCQYEIMAKFLARYKKNGDKVFSTIDEVINGKDNETLGKWLNQIEFCFFPKQVKSPKVSNIKTVIPPKQCIVERLLARVDIPVELQIIDALWISKYGKDIENLLYKDDAEEDDSKYGCWANRLDMDENNQFNDVASMFKPYYKQYQNWWRTGLERANSYLKKNKKNNKEGKVTIITFDIKDYYHSINLDFHDLFLELFVSNPLLSIEQDPLTDIVKQIYNRYWELTKKSSAEIFKGNYHCLPLGLTSANVISNWYLSQLDYYILSNCNEKLLYFSRYVDDCVLSLKTDDIDKENENLEKELDAIVPGLFKFNKDQTITFKMSNHSNYKRLKSLSIQDEKLFVYKFDRPFSGDEIEEDIKERGSEPSNESAFTYLSDEFDRENLLLENNTIVKLNSPEEGASRRITILDDSKYKLSTYLSKIAIRLSEEIVPLLYDKEELEEEDNNETIKKLILEVDKIKGFFKGVYLIKHYLLWEKILTIYVLSNRIDYFESTVKSICEEIDRIKVEDSLFISNKGKGIAIVKCSLFRFLFQAMSLSKNLGKKRNKVSLLSNISNYRKLVEKFKEYDYNKYTLDREFYNTYPLQDVSDEFVKYGLFAYPYTFNIFLKKRKNPFALVAFRYYYQFVLINRGKCSQNIYKKAFKEYLYYNGIAPKMIDSNAWQCFCGQSGNVLEFNTSSDISNEPVNLNVGVVNIDLSVEGIKKSLKSHKYHERNNSVFTGVDLLTNVNKKSKVADKIDLVIFPELSLSWSILHQLCGYSRKKKVAFIGGLDYIKSSNGIVYNDIITCIPMKIKGLRNDTLPIIRVKNHYAPKEKDILVNEGCLIPPEDMLQVLYHWKGHVFTTYYCYELTSVKERTFFFNSVDAIYSSVLNPDTYYFNNIVESTVRDMHCYFIMDNVARYGDSRVTQPTSHDNMNLLKVKGGVSGSNKANLLSCKLNVKALRAFQKLTPDEQYLQIKYSKTKDENIAKKIKILNDIFKQVPPGFDNSLVFKRENTRFLIKRNLNVKASKYLNQLGWK